MPDKLSLMLAFDGHLCAGADDSRFEQYYSETLRPFITALNRNPKIPCSLHLSGSLLERLEQKKKECFLLIREMAGRKQIELLGGGFYEPLLPLLPVNDRIGQIEMLTTYLRKSFGRKPVGCKLFLNAWEQSLTGLLASCGMNFTFLSEEQFSLCGEVPRLVLTEDLGKLIAVFPVFSSLAALGSRRVLPLLETWFAAYENIPACRSVTVFPDFPPVKNAKNGANEIDAFFEEVSLIASAKYRDDFFVELTLPTRVYRAARELPKIYFPNSADHPLGQSRAFLSRQREANDLYAKLFFVNVLINQLRGDKARKKAARGELMKAEGGELFCAAGDLSLSSPVQRRHAYKSILNAEQITREKKFSPSLLAFDFDFDHEAEYLFQDKNVNAYVSRLGASLFELDYLPKGLNFLDTFETAAPSRRRSAFIDRFFAADYSPAAHAFWELPPDRRGAYDVSHTDRQKLKAVFTLGAQKQIPFGNFEIKKSYSLEKNVLFLNYEITNRGPARELCAFAPQCDFTLVPGGTLLFKKTGNEEESVPAGAGETRRLLSVMMQDHKNSLGLELAAENPCDLFYAVTGGQEPQSLCLLPLFQLSLEAGESWNNRFTLSVVSVKRKS
ncbi:MAG: hypothetical protein LBB82_10385 [Treponema sp.]|jgi:hypothetical protein|nr:hypothetical protein [Treponema sp.]